MEAGGGEKPPALPTALPVEERAQAPAADNDYGDEFDDQEQLNAEIAEVMRLAEEEYAARMAAALLHAHAPVSPLLPSRPRQPCVRHTLPQQVA